jgi:hypothetical protein
VVLEAANAAFAPIVIMSPGVDGVRVIAEVVEVLSMSGGTREARADATRELEERLSASEDAVDRPYDGAALLGDPMADPGSRVSALRESVDRDAPFLPPLIVSLLSGPDLAAELRNALLWATERVQFRDPPAREQLAASLLRHAVALRQARPGPDEHAMWAALRRYGTLIHETEAELAPYLQFLEDLTSSTQEVALRSLANVFSVNPPAPSLVLGSVRARVVEVARGCLDPAWLKPGERGALALSAYVTAAVLVVGPVDELTERIIGLGKRWLLRQAIQELAPTLEQWRRAEVGPAEHALGVLGTTVGRLDEALARLVRQKKGG